MKAYLGWMGVVMVVATVGVSRPAAAQRVVTANVEVRRTGVPNSCDFSVFEPEIRITNTGTQPFLLSQAFVQVYFDAGADEIQSVHPIGSFATIFDSRGGFRSFDTVTVNKGIDFAETGPTPDRRANQSWSIFFDPPNPVGQDITLRPGDFALVIVPFRRANGASPFDLGCRDFTRVERGASNAFTNNRFYSLFFTSTQQHICEFLDPNTPDPDSGISPFPPFTSACQ